MWCCTAYCLPPETDTRGGCRTVMDRSVEIAPDLPIHPGYRDGPAATPLEGQAGA